MNQARLNTEVVEKVDLHQRLEDLVRSHLSQDIDVLAFVDKLLILIVEIGYLNCTLGPKEKGAGLVFKTMGGDPFTIDIPRARTMLRVICARLSVIAAEQLKRSVSVYGDKVEFRYPIGENLFQFHLRFENTPSHQEFDIQVRGPLEIQNGEVS
jgi:hypothetical protein